MKNNIQKLILLFFLCLSPLYSQNFTRGALFDPVRYEQTDSKPVLLSRSYSSLPRAVSLKQYCPLPGDQGNYRTCTAWSTAFAARTISESVTLERTDRTLTSGSVYSPAHIYKNISDDPTCKSGTYIFDALDLMKNEGAVKRLPQEITADFRDILLSLFSSSKRYPIADYVRLFSRYTDGSAERNVINVKKEPFRRKAGSYRNELPRFVWNGRV